MIAGAVKGQLIFRRCSGEADVAIGILEINEGAVDVTDSEDLLIDCLTQRGPSDTLGVNLHSRRKHDEDLSDCDIGQLVIQLKYPRASGGAQGGSLFIRSSSMPAPEGRQTVLVALVIEVTGEPYDPQIIHEVRGRDGIFTVRPGNPHPLEPHGKALSQIHRSAIWGWDEEKWGPLSTMRPDILALCQELQSILDEGRECDEQRRQELEKDHRIRYLISSGKSDQHYPEFRRRMIAEGHQTRWNAVITATDERNRTEAADRILRDILKNER